MKKLIHIFLPVLMPASFIFALLTLSPEKAWAIQFHASSEGVITHQMGHLFFLFSMGGLMFIITGKELDRQRGWRFIQLSALFFIFWNLDTLAAHFLDNQLFAVKMETRNVHEVVVTARNGSTLMAWLYYALKLDHLLCVPAMLFLFKGLSFLVDEQKRRNLS